MCTIYNPQTSNLYSNVQWHCACVYLWSWYCYTIQGKWTPLYYAARNGHTDIVALLVSRGADISMKDKVS